MEITEVRVKLMDEPGERLQAFCSITFDDAFVVRDLKIIEGATGPFVAMPSRKLTAHCPTLHVSTQIIPGHSSSPKSAIALAVANLRFRTLAFIDGQFLRRPSGLRRCRLRVILFLPPFPDLVSHLIRVCVLPCGAGFVQKPANKVERPVHPPLPLGATLDRHVVASMAARCLPEIARPDPIPCLTVPCGDQMPGSIPPLLDAPHRVTRRATVEEVVPAVGGP